MFTFLALLGFLGFIIFPIMAIVSLFKKNGKARRNFMIAGISLVVFLFGAVNAESTEITEEANQEQNEEVDKEAEQAEKEAQEKADKAAKEKAEKEAQEKADKAAKEKAEKEAQEKADKEAKKKATKEKVDKQAGLSDLKAHFIDVGQADTILLEYSEGDTNYNILIDSGDWNSNAAVNYLEQMNINKIDLLVGTPPIQIILDKWIRLFINLMYLKCGCLVT